MGTKAETTAGRRARRTRYKLKKVNRVGLPRLSVNRSNKQIYAQVIDDQAGKTLVAASTLDKELKASIKNGSTIEAAKQVGALLAKRASAAKIGAVQFDRGSYLYHGRVKALAEGARDGGMTF
jgi:large subunit ribosomal protein L18